MNKPLVTAAIRTYNRAHLLPYAIESVLLQTHKEIELIIMDDCSTDNTSELINKYVHKNKRIRHIRQKTNKGHTVAFNKIISTARGSYVAFLDDDDRWRRNKIRLQVEEFEKSKEKGKDIGIVTCAVQRWLTRGNVKRKLDIWTPKNKGMVYQKALGGSDKFFGPPSAVMLDREIIRNLGPVNENIKRSPEQYYFKLISKNYRISYINYIGVDYYYHKNTITRFSGNEDYRKAINTREISMITFGKDLKKQPKVYSNELRMLAHEYSMIGKLEEGKKQLKRSMKIAPSLNRFLIEQKLVSNLGIKFYKLYFNVKSKTYNLLNFFKSLVISKTTKAS